VTLASRILGSWTQDVTPQTLRLDVLAGLLGAVLVLPQAIAFALLAGLPAQYGLYTAIIPCIIAAIFGSSRHVMSGPTNTNSLALFAMLTPLAMAGSAHYIELALAVTIMVGIIQTSISIFKLGSLANFISPAVLGGFTSGAAILIALHATGGALGISSAGVHGAGQTLMHYIHNLSTLNIAALTVAIGTAGVILALKKYLTGRWPFMLIGLVAGAFIGVLLNLLPQHLHLGLVQQVGHIPSPIPPFHLPTVQWDRLPDLFGIAVALSIVALGQSISIAKALGARSGQVIDPNREFLGQGLSNMAGGFFSSYVSCGSLNRSLPNLEAGAQTPLASVASALLLVLLVLVFGPFLAYLPMAGISALLLLVAWSLLDLPRWRTLWTQQRTEFLIAASTLVATVVLRMEIAILLGTLLSLLAYLNRTSKPAVRIMGFLSHDSDRQLLEVDPANQAKALLCPQLTMVRMEGAVYFGATAHVSTKLAELRETAQAPKHLLVMARSMNFIDLSGAELWEHERRARQQIGGGLYFHRPRPDVLKMWSKTGFDERLGTDHVFHTKDQAIASIFRRLDPEICRTCQVRAFAECRTAPAPTPPDG